MEWKQHQSRDERKCCKKHGGAIQFCVEPVADEPLFLTVGQAAIAGNQIGVPAYEFGNDEIEKSHSYTY